MPRQIDLDSILAEAEGEPVVLQFGGREISLPPDLPLRFGDALGDGKALEALQTLVSDDEAQDIYDALGSNSLQKLLKAVTDLYLVTEGEASASPDSSESGGANSSPTSDGSTTSASRKRVTAVKDSA